jgi:DNA-binding transcriptional regulator YiaG
MSTTKYPAIGFNPADLVAARERLRITQGEAAQDLGVNVATLRRWEKGERAPSGALAAKVARWVENSTTGPRRDEPITGEEIQELRAALGLGQRDFGARYGGDYTTVSRWENGHVTPSRDARERMRRDLRKIRENAEKRA